MATKSVLGLYSRAADAANAVDLLSTAGFKERNLEVLTDSPYPEGAFGEALVRNRLPIFAGVGAISGFAVGLLITVGVQISYPLVTGGKPLLSIPPMILVMYEGTMLGAILMTVIGLIFEARMPQFRRGLYDPRITEGYIGLLVSADETQIGRAVDALRDSGAEEVIQQR